MFSSSQNLNCCLQSAAFATLNGDQCSIPRSLLMFTMENCFYVLVSQAVRYLKDPAIVPRDKQRLKQELSSELVRQHSSPDWTLVCANFSFTLQMNLTFVLSCPQSTLLSSLSRHFRRGSPSSPACSLLPSAQPKPTTPGSKAAPEGQEPFIQLVQAFVRLVQR